MSEFLDPDTSAIERILQTRARQPLPAALRTRVLAAVSDMLPTTAPATAYGNDAHSGRSDYPDAVAGTFLMVTPLSMLLVAMLPWAAAFHRDGPTADQHRLSFAQRAEAAGIALESEPPSGIRLADDRARNHDDALVRRHNILRSIDARSFLQGEL